jgi:hypothetical protein
MLQSCRRPRFAAPEGEDRGEDEGPAGAGAQRQQGTYGEHKARLHTTTRFERREGDCQGLGFWLLEDDAGNKRFPQSLVASLCRGKRGDWTKQWRRS